MSSTKRQRRYSWWVGGASALIAAELLWGGIMMSAKADDVSKKTTVTTPATETVAPTPVVRTAIEEYEIPDVLGDVTVNMPAAIAEGYTLTCSKGKETWLLFYKTGEKQPYKMAHFSFKK